MVNCDTCKRGYNYRIIIKRKAYRGIPKSCFECVRNKNNPKGTKYLPIDKE
jgi:hypothetical protein